MINDAALTDVLYSSMYGLPITSLTALPLTMTSGPHFGFGDHLYTNTSCTGHVMCSAWYSQWAPKQAFDFLLPFGYDDPFEPFMCQVALPEKHHDVLPDFYIYTTPAPTDAPSDEVDDDWTEDADAGGCSCNKILNMEEIVTLMGGGTAGATIIVGGITALVKSIDPEASSPDNVDEAAAESESMGEEDPSTMAQ